MIVVYKLMSCILVLRSSSTIVLLGPPVVRDTHVVRDHGFPVGGLNSNKASYYISNKTWMMFSDGETQHSGVQIPMRHADSRGNWEFLAYQPFAQFPEPIRSLGFLHPLLWRIFNLAVCQVRPVLIFMLVSADEERECPAS